MKFVCESCNELSKADHVRVDGDAIVLTCGSCGAETRLEENTTADDTDDAPKAAPAPRSLPITGPAVEPDDSAAQSPSDAAEPLPTKCPKCFHRQTRTDHCERCGLNLRRADLHKHAWEPDPTGKETAYAHALELWTIIESDPGNSDHHEAFVAHCTDQSVLDLCTRRYRERLSDRAGEEPTSTYLQKAVERMEKVALAMLAGDAWAKDLQRKVQKAKAALIVLAIALAILAVVLLFMVIKKKQEIAPFDL